MFEADKVIIINEAAMQTIPKIPKAIRYIQNPAQRVKQEKWLEW